jgi:hypothetical protein
MAMAVPAPCLVRRVVLALMSAVTLGSLLGLGQPLAVRDLDAGPLLILLLGRQRLAATVMTPASTFTFTTNQSSGRDDRLMAVLAVPALGCYKNIL